MTGDIGGASVVAKLQAGRAAIALIVLVVAGAVCVVLPLYAFPGSPKHIAAFSGFFADLSPVLWLCLVYVVYAFTAIGLAVVFRQGAGLVIRDGRLRSFSPLDFSVKIADVRDLGVVRRTFGQGRSRTFLGVRMASGATKLLSPWMFGLTSAQLEQKVRDAIRPLNPAVPAAPPEPFSPLDYMASQ